MNDWIANLFKHPELQRMGHGQRAGDLNLGLGWLYYAAARAIRPRLAVVIGSYRGFVPLVIGKALLDNGENGQVIFIDPSLVDDFWQDPAAVAAHFASFGITNIRHFLRTTQQFVETDFYRSIETIGLLFVDGYHTREQARFDFEGFKPLLTADAITFFHDSARIRTSRIYGPGRHYEHSVKSYMDDLKCDPALQVLDIPLFDGVTLVRRIPPAHPEPLP